MRITIILGPYYPVPTVLGGAVEKIQLQLAEAYAAAGHDVTMISRQFSSFPAEEVIAGVRHIRIASFDRGRNFAVNMAYDAIYSLRAARAMPPADITVTNSFLLPLFVPMGKAGRLYVHVARFPKGQFGLYRRADRFQAVSTVVAQGIVEQVPAYAQKVTVIGNPLREAYFTDRPKTSTVLFVGRVAREKGIGQLIEAFASLVQSGGCGPEWKLRIVGPHAFEQGGDGVEYLDELKRLAAPVGSRCEFVGPLFKEDLLIDEYAGAAIFVYPTLAAKGEALPLAPVEAMASRCAVVVSRLACFDDYVRDNENALQFDHGVPASHDHLVGILKTLTNSADLRHRLASAGQDTAGEFRLSIIAQKMLQDFGHLLAEAS